MQGVKRIFRLVVSVGLIAGFMVACGGGDSGAGSQALPCFGLADCEEGQVCVDVNSDGQATCEEVECDCAGCPECPDGYICSSEVTNSTLGGVCIPDGTAPQCLSDEDCPDGVCENGLCVDTPASCVELGCQGTDICDELTGECKPAGTEGFICEACSNDTDCGDADDSCTPLSSGLACTSGCNADAECAIGFKCLQATNAGKQCVPYSNKCTGCVVDGCPAGQICNFGNGQCTQAVATCGSCQLDYQCSGDGSSLCYRPEGSSVGVCGPACGQANACPENSSCSLSIEGRSVCGFTGGTCCYGAQCAACNCAADQPICVDGQCVQCLTDSDCPIGAGPCDLNTNQCAGSSCSDPTPFLYEGACVECLNGTHCGSGMCDTTTHTCSSDICDVCQDPYPACAEVGGQLTCVQCSAEDDSYCIGIGGTCDAATYTCQGGNPQVGNCNGNSECPPSPFDGTPMICDPVSGACIDPGGKCDGVTAMCPSGECASLLGAGGGGMPIPPELLGGNGIPGYCVCDPAQGNAECPSGLSCVEDQTEALLCAITSGGGDMQSLFQALLGGNQQAVCLPCGSGGGIPGFPF